MQVPVGVCHICALIGWSRSAHLRKSYGGASDHGDRNTQADYPR
jgi:hypothetical protein